MAARTWRDVEYRHFSISGMTNRINRPPEAQAFLDRADHTFVGVNWGSTNFRAYLIDADGSAIDEYSERAGVAALNREGLVDMMRKLASRWPVRGPIYASGMIGSNVGWIEVPYAKAPAGCAELAEGTVSTHIGDVPIQIVPGVSCRRSFDGEPDVLRGEEVELVGLASLRAASGWVALPGTHTKWARIEDGRIVDFFTSMSGELFDQLTANGLLASIVESESADGDEFLRGVSVGRARRLSLGTLLFGARAQVVCGELAKSAAASYIRGLLIGSEIADAMAAYPQIGDSLIHLVGNSSLCRLYASALRTVGVSSETIESREACLHGFRTLHEMRYG
jgi:2-dehydro-3-deoxygalactonokinase